MKNTQKLSWHTPCSNSLQMLLQKTTRLLFSLKKFLKFRGLKQPLSSEQKLGELVKVFDRVHPKRPIPVFLFLLIILNGNTTETPPPPQPHQKASSAAAPSSPQNAQAPVVLKSCGLAGSIKERISDCHTYKVSKTHQRAQLISREIKTSPAKITNEYWLDSEQNLVIGPSIKQKNGKPLQLSLDDAAQYCRALSTLNLAWRLPTFDELRLLFNKDNPNPNNNSELTPFLDNNDYHWVNSSKGPNARKGASLADTIDPNKKISFQCVATNNPIKTSAPAPKNGIRTVEKLSSGTAPEPPAHILKQILEERAKQKSP